MSLLFLLEVIFLLIILLSISALILLPSIFVLLVMKQFDIDLNDKSSWAVMHSKSIIFILLYLSICITTYNSSKTFFAYTKETKEIASTVSTSIIPNIKTKGN